MRRASWLASRDIRAPCWDRNTLTIVRLRPTRLNHGQREVPEPFSGCSVDMTAPFWLRDCLLCPACALAQGLDVVPEFAPGVALVRGQLAQGLGTADAAEIA